jgi:hypothetical protein
MALPPNIKPEEATELMEREIRKLELSRRGERAV